MALDYSILLFFIILSLIGIFLKIITTKLKVFQELEKVKETVAWTKVEKIPYKLLDINNPESQLEKITTKLVNNLRITIAVHGILLAFVVSSGTILLVFSSWYFVIWLGLILATIIRSGRYSIALSDVLETNGIKDTLRKCYAAKKFFNASLVILLINVILLPSIFLLDANESLDQKIQDNFHLSVISSSITIATSFSLFYFIVLSFSDYDYSYSEKNMIGITFIIIIFGAFLYTLSPVEPIFFQLPDNSMISIPLTIFVLPILGFFFFGIMLTHLINLVLMRLPHRALKIYASIFLR